MPSRRFSTNFMPTISNVETSADDDINVAAENNVSSDNLLDNTKPQNSSTDKLLQLAQAASSSIVQIPVYVLTSLLQTVNDLQTSVTKLEHENRALRQALSSVEKNVLKLKIDSGIEFASIPETAAGDSTNDMETFGESSTGYWS
jgi:cell division protein FtsB